jgi:hypothetical protein
MINNNRKDIIDIIINSIFVISPILNETIISIATTTVKIANIIKSNINKPVNILDKYSIYPSIFIYSFL